MTSVYLLSTWQPTEERWTLLQYPMTSHEGPRGQVALMRLLRSCEITEIILEKRIDQLRRGDSSNSTPLHFAAANDDDLIMLQMLLQHDASAAYIQDHEGFSVIHVAASAGHSEIVEELLAHCPDSMEQKNHKGRYFLHTAIEKNFGVGKYVLCSPLAFLKDIVNEQDAKGNTPLHLAVILRDMRIIQALLSSSIMDVRVMNNSVCTPLHLASSKCQNRHWADLKLD